MDWKAEAKKLKFEQGKSWTETANALKSYFPGLTEHQVRERVRDYLRSTDTYKAGRPVEAYREKTELKADGSFTSDKLIGIHSGEHLTPELLMAKHNIDPAYWQVTSYTNNLWHSQVKGGTRLTMYQSKVTVKPKLKSETTLEDIDRYFEGKDYSKLAPPEKGVAYHTDGDTLEIDIADPHAGLLTWKEETGEDFDLKILKNNWHEVMLDIADRCKHRKLKKIIMVSLGDMLHIDNNNQTTTKGTFQQADGRLEKIASIAEDMWVDAINILGEIAPIEIIYISGNHDGLSGYMFYKALKNLYKNSKTVTVDTAPNPMKHRTIGIALVGFVHGEMPKKLKANWLRVDARKEMGNTLISEVHTGHVHEESTYKDGDIMVRTMPPLCPNSIWSHTQGYRGLKGVMSYLWNDTTGLRETWYSLI